MQVIYKVFHAKYDVSFVLCSFQYAEMSKIQMIMLNYGHCEIGIILKYSDSRKTPKTSIA